MLKNNIERALLFEVLNRLPVNIFLKDSKSLKFVFINRSFEKLNNAEPGSMIGKSDSDYFPESQAAEFNKDDRGVLKSKHLKIIEEKINTSKGGFWLRTKKIPIINDEGQATHLLGIAEDITDEKKITDELNKKNLDLKLAEKEMRETNNLWQSVLDNMPINIFLKEAENLSFSFVNKSFEDLNNLPHGSMVGKSDSDYFSEDQVKEFRKADRGVLDSKKLKIIPEEMINTSKGDVWLRTKKIALLNDAGNSTHLLGIAEDITDEKKITDELNKKNLDLKLAEKEMRETNNLWQSVLDNMPINIFLKEAENLSFSFVNKSFEDLNNLPHGSMVGKSDSDYFSEDQVKEFRKADRGVLDSKKLKIIPEEMINTSKGDVWLRTKKIALLNDAGNSTHLLGIAEDITDEKKITDELNKKNTQLLKAKEDAQRANEAKSTFLANMSHELRTPLNAIIGYSEMLIEDAGDEGIESFIPDLEKISSSGKHLLGLINDILDLSKVESGKMELFIEEYNPQKLIEEIQSTIQPLISKNNNKLKIEYRVSGENFRSDITKMKQIILNLLSNATKFTQDGEISLIAIDSKESSDAIKFIIKDTGIGMTKDQVKKVFQPFTQADENTTRKFGGTGLGLTITKMFTEMMGGFIELRSEKGEGTTFIIEIPKKVVDKTKDDIKIEEEPRHKSSQKNRFTVLIIDDDQNSIDMMSRFLKKQGYAVMSACSGLSGIELAVKHTPDMITLDVIMPEMDGWEVLASLQENEKTKNIPVIMVTLANEPDLGFSLGATDYLTKPIDWNSLSSILKKHQIASDSHSILIVEDDEITVEMLKKSLESDNYKVRSAKNGKEALDIINDHKPGLILLDLMMPEMDGFQFAERLREKQQWLDIPVVVITAKDLSKDDHSRLQGNVEAIMQKGSYRKDELLQEISSRIKKIESKV